MTAPTRDRRQAARVPKSWPAEIKNSSGKLWRGRSVDVSPGSMRVRVDRPLELRGVMFVAFDPGDGIGPMWTSFSLVRDGGAGEYALRFLDLPAKNIERLNRLLASSPRDRTEAT